MLQLSKQDFYLVQYSSFQQLLRLGYLEKGRLKPSNTEILDNYYVVSSWEQGKKKPLNLHSGTVPSIFHPELL